MHIASVAAIAALTAAALAAPTPSLWEHVVHERRSESASWTKRDRVHEDVKLPMRIGLSQSNLDKGPDYLMEVSHPDSARYGKHYTVEEVTKLFAPSHDTVEAVRSWLHAAGIQADRVTQSVNKQWLQFDAKTSEVESLLKTQYHFYENDGFGKASIACEE